MAQCEILEYNYHRNGIGGQGFYSVEFTLDNTECKGERFLAMVTASEAYVISSDSNHGGIDHKRGYRGTDFFGPYIREALAEKLGYSPFN